MFSFYQTAADHCADGGVLLLVHKRPVVVTGWDVNINVEETGGGGGICVIDLTWCMDVCLVKG